MTSSSTGDNERLALSAVLAVAVHLLIALFLGVVGPGDSPRPEYSGAVFVELEPLAVVRETEPEAETTPPPRQPAPLPAPTSEVADSQPAPQPLQSTYATPTDAAPAGPSRASSLMPASDQSAYADSDATSVSGSSPTGSQGWAPSQPSTVTPAEGGQAAAVVRDAAADAAAADGVPTGTAPTGARSDSPSVSLAGAVGATPSAGGSAPVRPDLAPATALPATVGDRGSGAADPSSADGSPGIDASNLNRLGDLGNADRDTPAVRIGTEGTGDPTEGSGEPTDGINQKIQWEGSGTREPRATPSPVLGATEFPEAQSFVVVVEFSVDEGGGVAFPKKIESNAPSDVDAKIILAVRSWRFSPAAGAPLQKATVRFEISVPRDQ